MNEIATIQFTDVESHKAGCLIARASKDRIGLCVSLQQGGDIEVFLNIADGKRLLKALQTAISSLEQAL